MCVKFVTVSCCCRLAHDAAICHSTCRLEPPKILHHSDRPQGLGSPHEQCRHVLTAGNLTHAAGRYGLRVVVDENDVIVERYVGHGRGAHVEQSILVAPNGERGISRR